MSAAFPVAGQPLDLRPYPQSFLGIQNRLAQRRPLPQQRLMRHLHGAFLTCAVAGQQAGVDERLDNGVFLCGKLTAFEASSSWLTCFIDRDKLQQCGQNQTAVSPAVQFVGEQVSLPLQRADHASEGFVSFGGHHPFRAGTCIVVKLLQGPGEQWEGITSCGVLHHPLDKARSEIESCPLRWTLNDLRQPSPAERLNQQSVVDCLGQARPVRSAAEKLRAQRGDGPHRAIVTQSAAQQGEELFLRLWATASDEFFGLINYQQDAAACLTRCLAEFVTKLDEGRRSLIQTVEEPGPGTLVAGSPERRLEATRQALQGLAAWLHRRNDHPMVGEPFQPRQQPGTQQR